MKKQLIPMGMVVVALTAPVTIAAYLLSYPTLPVGATVVVPAPGPAVSAPGSGIPSGGRGGRGSLAAGLGADLAALGAPQAGSAAGNGLPVQPRPLLSGVLYTRGKAIVHWNGVRIEVEDSSYAYVGGETISTEEGAVAVLQLDGGSTVYVCPGSSGTVQRQGGGFHLDLALGSSRFAFTKDTPFEVRSEPVTLTPKPETSRAGEDTGASRRYVAEVVNRGNGGGMVCDLSKDHNMSHSGGAKGLPQVSAGNVWSYGPNQAGGFGVTSIGFPDDVRAALGRQDGNTGYLCRCEEIRRYADAAQAAPPVEPLVAPPDAPLVALSPLSPPDPFDPDVLSPPGAGDEPVIVPTPPIPPVGGGGGGGGRVVTGGGPPASPI